MGRPTSEARQTLNFISDLLDQLIRMVPPQAGALLPHLLKMAQTEAAEASVRPRQDRMETRPPE